MPRQRTDADVTLTRLAGILESAPPGSERPGTGSTGRLAGRRWYLFYDIPGAQPPEDRNGFVEPAVAGRTEAVEDNRQRTVALPVKGLNIPFSDMALADGDAVVVEAPQEQFVSVLGLVARAGQLPLPAHSALHSDSGYCARRGTGSGSRPSLCERLSPEAGRPGSEYHGPVGECEESRELDGSFDTAVAGRAMLFPSSTPPARVRTSSSTLSFESV